MLVRMEGHSLEGKVCSLLPKHKAVTNGNKIMFSSKHCTNSKSNKTFSKSHSLSTPLPQAASSSLHPSIVKMPYWSAHHSA